MVSAASTTTQEEHGDNKVLSEAVKGIAISEHQLNHEDEMIPKVRKPYTITKQRERWTEEEHKKFIEALKLYGRAWRKIEEHVGSKTAVQIRSHAQKFFSKITRETEGGDESAAKPIEIPPPRPKRKPLHPYPRKNVAMLSKAAVIEANTSVSDQENQSPSPPTSVLSAIGSESATNGAKEGSSKSSYDAENSSEEEQQILDLLPHYDFAAAVKGCSNESNGQFLKLFGKTFIVSECNNEGGSPKRVVARKFHNRKTSEFSGRDLPWLTLYSEELNDCSSDPSDEERSTAAEGLSVEFKGKVKNLISSNKLSKRISADSKGFVPYKRCAVENSDERDKQRIRVEA